jgi:hypothetical protein
MKKTSLGLEKYRFLKLDAKFILMNGWGTAGNSSRVYQRIPVSSFYVVMNTRTAQGRRDGGGGGDQCTINEDIHGRENTCKSRLNVQLEANAQIRTNERGTRCLSKEFRVLRRRKVDAAAATCKYNGGGGG